MIKQHYSGSARRSVNIIWNAAQDYSFDPPFQAFYANGKPDDYLNMVIGLAMKWLDRERITDFFERLGTGPTLDEASGILWLGIENCVFGKELTERPLIGRMRRDHAEEFFRVSGMLSPQQISFMSRKEYDQEEARWGKVLGRRVLDIGPSARKLARELEFDPSWDTDLLLGKMNEILKVYFRITLPDRPRTSSVRIPGWRKALAGLLPGREPGAADLLVLRRGSGSGDRKGSVHLTHDQGSVHTSEDAMKDQEYIRTVFGPCMYSDTEMRILEGSLCDGNDLSCRLWITDGSSSRSGRGEQVPGAAQPEAAGKKQLREAAQLEKERKKQRLRNEKYYQDHIFRITESIRNLSAQTDSIFQSYLRFLPARSGHGKLYAPGVWRLPVLNDGKVFQTDSDIAEADLTVDLLLDASQSRMNSQELICAQALVIAKSLENCHIPVRVTSFRSLRGYTVLQRLKEYGDRRCEGLFDYYAGGWNRDGLCLKTMDYLLEDERKQGGRGKNVLLVLTDAHPNDSVPLAPKPGSLFSREYEGDEAVRDAEAAVRLLRSHGTRCGAIFYGSTSHLDHVHQIYGQHYVRIRSLNQLSDAAAQLLQMCLREM